MLYICIHYAGIEILPDWLSREAEKQGLIQRVFTEWEFSMFPTETAIWILYPKKKLIPYKVFVFIGFMVEKSRVTTILGVR